MESKFSQVRQRTGSRLPHQAFDLYGISNVSVGKGHDEDEYLRWTYGDLERAIKKFVNALRHHGFKEGDLVLTFAGNSAEFVISTRADYRIGLIHVPINPKNLSYDREARHMLNTAIAASCSSSPRIAIIASNGNLCTPIEELTAGLDCLKILVESNGSETGWASFGDLMQLSSEIWQKKNSSTNISKSRERSLPFTSGTTSLPKGCFIQTSAFPFTVAVDWQ